MMQGGLARFTNEYGRKRQAPFGATRLDMSDDPKHERENFGIQFGADFKPGTAYPMNGFMQNYSRDPGLSADDYGQVMGFFTAAEIPVTAFLADNYAICDNWFAPIPTSTQPNRLMAMGGFAKIDNTFSNTVPDQDLVYDWCGRQNKRHVRWRAYHEGWPFFMVMNRWRLEILADAVAGRGQFSPLGSLRDDFKHDKDFRKLCSLNRNTPATTSVRLFLATITPPAACQEDRLSCVKFILLSLRIQTVGSGRS
jgi:hypothetical protein